MKPKLVVIVGPTAAGKSALAVRLAKKFNGEIISADSRQIYRGLDIGSGKVPGRWQGGVFRYKGVPHHLIDEINPKQTFTVAEYQRRAAGITRDILARNKMPILVGGTGFWIDAVVSGLRFPAVEPNTKLRRALRKKSSRALLRMLQKLDLKRAKTIEAENPRRLIRAIEIARALGRVPALTQRPPFQALWLGLAPPRRELEENVGARIAAMLRPVTKSAATAVGSAAHAKHSRSGSLRGLRKTGNFVTGLRRGLIRETKKLIKRVSRKRIREFGFEYQACLEYLEGKLTREALRARLIRDSLGYARRQMTWWKRNPEIHWMSSHETAERLVRKFMRSSRSAE